MEKQGMTEKGKFFALREETNRRYMQQKFQRKYSNLVFTSNQLTVIIYKDILPEDESNAVHVSLYSL